MTNYAAFDYDRPPGVPVERRHFASRTTDYLQIWAECGTIALRDLHVDAHAHARRPVARVRRQASRRYHASWILSYATMFETSMFAFLCGSVFLNRAQFDLIYHYIAIVLIFGRLARAGMADEQRVSHARHGPPLRSARRDRGRGFERRVRVIPGFRDTRLLSSGAELKPVCEADRSGFLDPSRDRLASRSGRMTRAIAHRGPDDEEIYVRGGVGLGFRRLSIIDVAGGKQPHPRRERGHRRGVQRRDLQLPRPALGARLARCIASARARTSRRSCTSTRRKARDSSSDLVGMFAFAVVDFREEARRECCWRRDRLGIKPLYCGRDERRPVVGERAESAARERAVPARALRLARCCDYLSCKAT